MDLVEGDFSRNRREAEAARKARLVAIGRKVWLETWPKQSRKIEDKTALALGRDLEKAARWLAIGAPVPEYRDDLQTLRAGVAAALVVIKGKAGGVIAQRLEPILMAGDKPIDWREACDALAALDAAAGEALGRNSAGEQIQEIFGSTAKLWARRVAQIYERFFNEKPSIGNGTTPGPFYRFCTAAHGSGVGYRMSPSNIREALKAMRRRKAKPAAG